MIDDLSTEEYSYFLAHGHVENKSPSSFMPVQSLITDILDEPQTDQNVVK
tara:strand:+ start:742 stop:891 length:150 start_codon:yes stop_codon:yes gene_type:complete